jgi:hypothetical protein
MLCRQLVGTHHISRDGTFGHAAASLDLFKARTAVFCGDPRRRVVPTAGFAV